MSSRGVDFSPDGSYFVVVTSGGPNGTVGLCDAAARFETANVSATAAPTWINWTGGDSLYSVAATGAAVYVGGHQRWLDNPFGQNSAGPGRRVPARHRRHRPHHRQGAVLEPHQGPEPRDREALRHVGGALGGQRWDLLRRPEPPRHRLLPAHLAGALRRRFVCVDSLRPCAAGVR